MGWHSGIDQIIGKRIARVIAVDRKEDAGKEQLFLIFTDNTLYGLNVFGTMHFALEVVDNGYETISAYLEKNAIRKFSDYAENPDLGSDRISPAERLFVTMAQAWRSITNSCVGGIQLPYNADQLALAAVLFSVEHPEAIGSAARREIDFNLGATEVHNFTTPDLNWADLTPWHLCLLGDATDADKQILGRALIEGIGNPSSSIRCWMQHILWLAAPLLQPEKFLPVLLDNVASQLGYVLDALGLARKFAGTEEVFEETVAAYKPADQFRTQFNNRIEKYRTVGFMLAQHNLMDMENGCRKIITKYALE